MNCERLGVGECAVFKWDGNGGKYLIKFKDYKMKALQMIN